MPTLSELHQSALDASRQALDAKRAAADAWQTYQDAQAVARDAKRAKSTGAAPVAAPTRPVMPEAEVRAKSMDPHYWPAVDLYLCVRTPEPVDTSRYPVERLRQAIEHQEAMDRIAARKAREETAAK